MQSMIDSEEKIRVRLASRDVLRARSGCWEGRRSSAKSPRTRPRAGVPWLRVGPCMCSAYRRWLGVAERAEAGTRSFSGVEEKMSDEKSLRYRSLETLRLERSVRSRFSLSTKHPEPLSDSLLSDRSSDIVANFLSQ